RFILYSKYFPDFHFLLILRPSRPHPLLRLLRSASPRAPAPHGFVVLRCFPRHAAGSLALTNFLHLPLCPPTTPLVPRVETDATTDASVADASHAAVPHDRDDCPPHANPTLSTRSLPTPPTPRCQARHAATPREKPPRFATPLPCSIAEATCSPPGPPPPSRDAPNYKPINAPIIPCRPW